MHVSNCLVQRWAAKAQPACTSCVVHSDFRTLILPLLVDGIVLSLQSGSPIAHDMHVMLSHWLTCLLQGWSGESKPNAGAKI